MTVLLGLLPCDGRHTMSAWLRALRDLVRAVKEHPSYAQRAKEAGEQLLSLGGLSRIVEILQEEVAKGGVRDQAS